MDNNYCGKKDMGEEIELGEIQIEINELSYTIARLDESICFLGEKLMPVRANTPKGSGATGTQNISSVPFTEIGNKIAVLKDRIREIIETVNIIKSEIRI